VVNEARISRLYVVKSGGDVQDATPNAPDQPPNPPALTFNLVLEMEAGGAVAGQYDLHVVAYDLTAGAVNNTMKPPVGVLNGAGNFAAAPWNVSLGDWTFDQQVPINVPQGGNGVTGHIFKYVAALVSHNYQQVDIKESELFVLV
jgi:hypothetical protein